ncbi:MAG: glycosyltransferase [Chitinophagales bacterium]|nr:glycosyltransferase [Chitinophagales bacterium]
MPGISVILPVYNGLPYLKESVESVLAQTYNDFELLVLDDCSADGSWEYLESISDPRLKLSRNDVNKGLFYNLNFMSKKAEAPLVKLWSQDDYMVPEALGKIVAFHKEHPGLGMSYTAVKIIDENSTVVKEAKEDITPTIVDQETHARIAFRWGSIAGNIANVTIAKEAYNNVGYFDEGMKICGDFDMWVRIGEFYNIGFMNEPIVYLRSHSGQLSRQEVYYIKHVVEDIIVYKKLFAYIPPQLRSEGLRDMRESKLVFYYTLMMNALKKSGVKLAYQFWKEISKFDNPFILTWYFVKVKVLHIK